MKTIRKLDFPLAQLRRFLEPSPTVLVSSQYRDKTNIMTMNWYTVMEFSPALIGCVISEGNHSFSLIRKSKQCVINIPTAEMIDTVVAIGNSDGDEIDKFEAYGLTKQHATRIHAPMIAECYANIECRLVETRFIKKYNFFVFKAVKAHIRGWPTYPKTMHYRGDGIFMLSGENIQHKRGFREGNL